MSVLNALLGSLDATSVIVFLVVFLVGYYLLTNGKPPNMPPGPAGLPLIGSMHTLRAAGSNMLGQHRKWREQYGDVYTIKIGNQNVVFISDYKILQETFMKHGDIFSGRAQDLYLVKKMMAATGAGVLLSEGPVWKELRRVTLMTMRDFGVGKKSLEQQVQDEARAVVAAMEQGQGRPALVKPLLSKFACNVICSIILGNRFEYEDSTFITLTRLVTQTLSQAFFFLPVNFLPPLRLLPSFRKTVQDVVDSFVTTDQFLGTVLKEHEESYDPSEIRDFVDFYIKTRADSSQAHLYNASNMRRVIIDLFFAGTETSATTGDWIVLYLIGNPQVEKRCFEQIDKVVGLERMVTMDDRKNLPYIEATFTELLRIVSIAPLGLPHVATQDGPIGDYTVPAGTIVIPNISAIHHNPSSYPDPEAFKPERFLDKDGNFCPPKQNYVPFSLGPRVCLGEVVARMEVFILFCTLVQSFTFSLPQGQKPDFEGQLGVTYSAKPQPVIAKRR